MMSEADDTTVGKPVNLIRLHDGTLIDPLTREPITKSLQPQKSSSAVRGDEPSDDDDDETDDDADGEIGELTITPTHRRSIMDLALNAQQMAVINNVLVYTLWGLPDDEIAIQCNCSIHQVHIVRDLDDYKRMYGAMLDGLRNAYMDNVNGIIQNAAPVAARSMVRNLKHKSPDIRMSAMKDILDRAGHRPADRVEHTHNIGNGSELVIRVIKQNDADNVPSLDLSINA